MSMLRSSVMRGPALWLVHVIVVLQATPALVLGAESNESVCLSLQHRVARDIGEMFADMKTLMARQSQHNNDLMTRLDTIDDRLDTIDDRLDTIDDRLNSVENATMARLDAMEITQDQKSQNTMDNLPQGCEGNKTGLTKIFATDSVVTVPCDGQGWMVIQRRVDNLYNFPTRPWNDYKNGFGDKAKSFWLGLQAMHQLTSGNHSSVLKIELTSFHGESRYAQYSSFRVGGEAEGYRLHVGEYSGTAGDSMKYHDGAKFSTADWDQDTAGYSCAVLYQGAWWYKNCAYANLNSVYTATGTGPYTKIMYWSHWLGYSRSYKIVTMKVRWE